MRLLTKSSTAIALSSSISENNIINVGHQAQCSWAGKVRVSDSSTRCTLERLARQPVGSILTIPQDMQMADSAIWKRSMVGFFVSYKMPFHAVQAVANRIWKGPWMFGGKAILLQQWHPGFQFDKNKIKTIPVWVRLQGLPFPLWNKKGLSLAASMVGKPVASDEATLHGRRLEYARVCIEIDANVPLVHHFQVASTLSDEPITVDVTYEWKPAKCDTCHVFGHSCKNQGKKEILEGKIVENRNNTGSKAISTKTPLLDDQDTGEKEGLVTAAQQVAVPTAPKEGDMVSGATSPHGPSIGHQAVVPTAPMEGDKASGESSPHGSTNLDSMGQPKLQDRLKGQQGRKDHTGSIVMCMDNKDSLGSSVHERDRDKGKGVIEENSDSFFNGNPQASPTTSSSSTPKQKKKKKGGKKKKEAGGLRM
ncbi:zinc ion binding / nucleic acid binding protein [Salix suchowensis]|nr:zinc ion binding / nucleic acid binding protein [Salix suchowensis]